MGTENMENSYQIPVISKEQKTTIKNMGVFALPDSPAAYGMKAGVVKSKFWEPLVEGDHSLVGLINAMISTLNDILKDVQEKQEGSVTSVVFDKKTRNLTVSFGFREEENDAPSTVLSLGNGIEKIEYLSSVGLLDTYQITYLSGETSTFTVKNGEKGDDGKDAVAPQIRINTETNKWEISTDSGQSWTSTGVEATGARGPKGEPFRIAKNYESVEQMLADTSNDVDVGQFVAILSNVEDEDNAKVYEKTESGYVFVVDMSGKQGIQGPAGETGQNGYTPVRGTDYWTEADKTEIVNDVLNSLPVAEKESF